MVPLLVSRKLQGYIRIILKLYSRRWVYTGEIMKDGSVLTVLMYLFKNHMQENCTLDAGEKKLFLRLEKLGFHRAVIDQAFRWLDNLSQGVHEPMQLPTKNSFRVFSDYECELLDSDCRHFLITLEQQSILNSHTRELVINQAIELISEGIDVSLLKWVTLMVLFNQTDKKQALVSMKLFVFDDTLGGMH